MSEQIGKDRRICNLDDEAKAAKRATSKARRRQEKRDPENAPKRPQYRGWVA